MKRLHPRRGAMRTPRLRLATSVIWLRSSVDGSQGFSADHLVLSISNRTDVPPAYRVVTSVANPHRCGSKAEIAHNAF